MNKKLFAVPCLLFVRAEDNIEAADVANDGLSFLPFGPSLLNATEDRLEVREATAKEILDFGLDIS